MILAILILAAGLVGGAQASVVQPSFAGMELSLASQPTPFPLVAEPSASSEHYHYHHGLPEKCDQTGIHIHAHSHCSGCATAELLAVSVGGFGNMWFVTHPPLLLPLIISRIDYPPKRA